MITRTIDKELLAFYFNKSDTVTGTDKKKEIRSKFAKGLHTLSGPNEFGMFEVREKESEKLLGMQLTQRGAIVMATVDGGVF